MSTKNTRNKGTLQQRVRSLIAGTQKEHPTGQLTFGGNTYESSALVQLLQNLDGAIAASDAAKAKWNDALKVMQDEEAKMLPVIRAYQSYLVSLLGNATPLTVEQQAAAAAKRKATRKARNTMGSVQKKAVTGDVASVVITPVTVTKSIVATPAAATPAQGSSPTGSAPHTS